MNVNGTAPASVGGLGTLVEEEGAAVPDYDSYVGDVDSELGPLPPKWEKAYTDNGEVYFIDHTTGTSHWLDPRLSKFQKKSLEDCLDDELPYGWEKITDPQYGTYFIDHVNRRTQYENPVLQAKQRKPAPGAGRASFTREPAELCGERITTTLTKSSRGLGFTIVGGDDEADEFLQIKSIVPNGPAWLDGRLQTGDLIVHVNGTCVLGFSHNQAVNLFQSITPGEAVTLEVCRGYPLPFDPNDPNTEVVTTVAVDSSEPPTGFTYDANLNFDRHPVWKYNGGVADCLGETRVLIHIVKGAMGFGFTIADSACGQRVKKILDRQRCKNLQEGDVLLEINHQSVQQQSHDQVVDVLKNCPTGEEAAIVVQRGQCHVKPRGALFRSKTPTADLYSTQQKEVLPSRPKTPLVDTRTRSKTPLAEVSRGASSTSSCQSDVLNSNNADQFYNHYEACYCADCARAKLGSADLRSWDSLSSRLQHTLCLDNEMLVTLQRQESGFGFRIVGGTEEGSQVAVGHIVPGGAADLDGRIRTGDVILSVDEHSVVNSSHHQVVQLMGVAAAGGRVRLRVLRRQPPTYDVVVTRAENEGFGFVIISSANKAGSTIGRLIEGSPAERCGLLQVGDCIVAVNHIPITHMCHGDIVNLIKDSGYSVVLSIGAPVDAPH